MASPTPRPKPETIFELPITRQKALSALEIAHPTSGDSLDTIGGLGGDHGGAPRGSVRGADPGRDADHGAADWRGAPPRSATGHRGIRGPAAPRRAAVFGLPCQPPRQAPRPGEDRPSGRP